VAEIRTSVRVETRLDIWRRRVLTIPGVCLAFLLCLLTLPIWLPIAFCIDLASKFRRATLRCGIFLGIYLGCEIAGTIASLLFWLADVFGPRGPASRERSFERHFALQRWWAGTLLHAAIRIFRFEIRVEGHDLLDRPMILMLRHTSIADTLLANEFVSQPHRIHLRHIIKRELLFDPCLDIVGHRLPNYFIDRESDDPAEELAGVTDLLDGLRATEGVLIYPEGTRFTKEKRERLIERFEMRGKRKLADRARSLLHTLPPRLGGSLALLQANPGLDVVFCAHSGFESAARPSDLLRGSLVRKTIAVRFWRVACAEIPLDPEDRDLWLYDQWRRIDRWVGEQIENKSELETGSM
jgi:1-acyl-sn-glycerol-3-phosphate acyltransferase